MSTLQLKESSLTGSLSHESASPELQFVQSQFKSLRDLSSIDDSSIETVRFIAAGASGEAFYIKTPDSLRNIVIKSVIIPDPLQVQLPHRAAPPAASASRKGMLDLDEEDVADQPKNPWSLAAQMIFESELLHYLSSVPAASSPQDLPVAYVTRVMKLAGTDQWRFVVPANQLSGNKILAAIRRRRRSDEGKEFLRERLDSIGWPRERRLVYFLLAMEAADASLEKLYSGTKMNPLVTPQFVAAVHLQQSFVLSYLKDLGVGHHDINTGNWVSKNLSPTGQKKFLRIVGDSWDIVFPLELFSYRVYHLIDFGTSVASRVHSKHKSASVLPFELISVDETSNVDIGGWPFIAPLPALDARHNAGNALSYLAQDARVFAKEETATPWVPVAHMLSLAFVNPSVEGEYDETFPEAARAIRAFISNKIPSTESLTAFQGSLYMLSTKSKLTPSTVPNASTSINHMIPMTARLLAQRPIDELLPTDANTLLWDMRGSLVADAGRAPIAKFIDNTVELTDMWKEVPPDSKERDIGGGLFAFNMGAERRVSLDNVRRVMCVKSGAIRLLFSDQSAPPVIKAKQNYISRGPFEIFLFAGGFVSFETQASMLIDRMSNNNNHVPIVIYEPLVMT